MSEIVAVLVVAADVDPGGLLAPGQCDATPPIVQCYGSDWRELYDEPDDYAVVTAAALPLWWDGRLCEEGWDRLTRAWRRSERPKSLAGTDVLERENVLAHLREPRLRDVLDVGAGTVVLGLASRVVRLARVDGHLVEVP